MLSSTRIETRGLLPASRWALLATTANGFVQYGPNMIGSINCLPAAPMAALPAKRKP
jgi:hypothetical protein